MRLAYFSSPKDAVPLGDYGPGFFIFIAYFVYSAIGMIISIPKLLKITSGVQQMEGQFLLFGWLFGFSFGVVLFTTSNLMGTQEANRFLPLFPLIMNSFVAYGIAGLTPIFKPRTVHS
jgi:hypothetical protein